MGRTLQRWKPLFIRGGRYSLAVLGLLVLAAVGAEGVESRFSDKDAWRDACRISQYSCLFVKRPFVVEIPMQGVLGLYRMGNNYIFVHPELPPPLAYAVRVHEMTHYLQWRHGKWEVPSESRCRNEHEAFDVSNVVLRRLGETKRLVEWDVVKGFYGCP